MENEKVDIKYFERCSWKGFLLIIREDQVTISVCAKSTLNRIPKNKNRKSPHYLQTVVQIENRAEVSTTNQMTLADIDSIFVCGFSDEDYEKDFLSIMEETLSLHDDYRHWIITYETEKLSVVSLSAVKLDKNFGIVQEIPLMELLKPDFGELTTMDTMAENGMMFTILYL